MYLLEVLRSENPLKPKDLVECVEELDEAHNILPLLKGPIFDPRISSDHDSVQNPFLAGSQSIKIKPFLEHVVNLF